MDQPERINIAPELWLEVREAAARKSVSISQFLIDAFSAEASRLQELAAESETRAMGDDAAELTHDELAELAIRNALRDDRDETGATI